MTKRYYIAGPITGEDSVDVRLSFYRMERKLLDSGFKVYNPAALPDGLDWGTYMQMALAVLCSDLFDGIIMLRGWSRSNGAQIERLAAQAIGIPIFYEDDTAKAESESNMHNLHSGDLIGRADAIEAVCNKCPISFKDKCEWKDNGHCSMKVALEALPSAEAVEAIHDMEWVALRRNEYEDLLASTEAVQGEWIKDGQFWRCSECGTRIFSESYMDRQIYHAFCSRCGANMTKGGEDE